MALQPFSWGAGGQKLSPSQVKKYSDIAAALAARAGAPKTLGEGLNRVGEALVAKSYEGRSAAGEAEGAKSRGKVLEALMANPDPSMADLMGAMGNEWVTADPGSSAVVQALMGQEIQQNDPAYQLGLEKLGLEVEDMRSPQVEPIEINGQLVHPQTMEVMGDFRDPQQPGAPEVKTIFDPTTGREQVVQWNGTDWEPVGGVAAPDDPMVTVNTGDGSSQWNKTLDENNAKRYLALQDEAVAAQRAISSFSAMDQLLNDPSLYSGAGGEGVLALKRIGSAMGLNPDGIVSAEAFNALSKQAALDVMGGSLGTGFSNADRDFVIDQVANLGNTPEGNRKIIEIQKKLAQRKVEIAKLANEYVERVGQLDNGFDRELTDWAAANPLFPVQTTVPESTPAGPQNQADPAIFNPQAPAPGTVVDGYRFKGGDPSQESNWEKL